MSEPNFLLIIESFKAMEDLKQILFKYLALYPDICQELVKSTEGLDEIIKNSDTADIPARLKEAVEKIEAIVAQYTAKLLEKSA